MTQFAPRTAMAIMRATRVVMQTPVSLIAPPRHRPSAAAAGLDLSKFCFGVTFSGATVTIKSGEVAWGINAPVVMLDAGPITLTADYQYIGLEFDSAVPSVVTLGPSANVAIFRSDASKYRRWIYQFRLISGIASLYRIGHTGNIDIPGWFGS